MSLAIPAVSDISNKPIQPKPYSRSGVLHSLRVFQHSEALVGILHGILLWGVDLDGVGGVSVGRNGSVSAYQSASGAGPALSYCQPKQNCL
jgi:hypothetical protein